MRGKGDDEELLDVIIRNAKRLQCLSENILDVTKIESQEFTLSIHYNNIPALILKALVIICYPCYRFVTSVIN
jgi:K+-sensing histidine kinase KdpD